jgi:hypothetical protein
MMGVMDQRERVLLPIIGGTGEEPEFDLASLLLHTLLFEQVVLSCHRFLEINAIARAFGTGTTRDLLDAGIVVLDCQADAIATVNRSDDIVELRHVLSADFDADTSRYLSELRAPNGTPKELQKLKRSVLGAWKKPATSEEWREEVSRWGLRTVQETVDELDNDRRVVGCAVAAALALEGLPGRAEGPRVEVVNRDRGLVRIGFNQSDLDAQEHQRVTARAVRITSRLTGFFLDMQRHTAVTGMPDDSAELLDAKLATILAISAPDQQLENFRRVVNIKGLPDFEAHVHEKKLDVDKLLQVRETAECREFRQWLRGSTEVTHDDIVKRTGGFAGVVGNFLHSGVGKSVRLVATTAVGLALAGAAGAALGMVASGLDSFLLEKLFPRSGIAAFLGNQYPSLFDRGG